MILTSSMRRKLKKIFSGTIRGKDFEMVLEYDDFIVLFNKAANIYIHMDEDGEQGLELIKSVDIDSECDEDELLDPDFLFDISGEYFHEPKYLYFNIKEDSQFVKRNN